MSIQENAKTRPASFTQNGKKSSWKWRNKWYWTLGTDLKGKGKVGCNLEESHSLHEISGDKTYILWGTANHLRWPTTNVGNFFALLWEITSIFDPVLKECVVQTEKQHGPTNPFTSHHSLWTQYWWIFYHSLIVHNKSFT